MHVSMSQNFRAAVKKEEKCRVASTAMGPWLQWVKYLGTNHGKDRCDLFLLSFVNA